jgi:hypothetical protein
MCERRDDGPRILAAAANVCKILGTIFVVIWHVLRGD